MSNYHYYQLVGGDEDWKIVPKEKVASIPPHMYRTVLSLDSPPTEHTTKEGYAAIKFSGPLYFDLDDSESPASTAKHLVTLLEALKKLDVSEECVKLYASGGKGFHATIAQEVFINKPQKGYPFLPAIYKEMAYELSVPSMDFRVYSARKGRMFRVENVKRPNNLYKVQITVEELKEIAEAPKEVAEEMYKNLCAAPRNTWEVKTEPQAFGLMGLFDSSRKKVEALGKRAAKAKPIDLPDELPSFEAMLRGEGIKSDVGFHPIAVQIAVTAHARGMTWQELIEAAQGLINNHVSDGHRYNTPDKRRRELMRMYDYMEDNPCYQYSPGAIRALLSHSAPDLAGVEASAEEIQQGIENPDEGTEYDHAGVFLTKSGVSIPAEGGTKKALALAFDNVTEMVSSDSGRTTVIMADVSIPGGRFMGQATFELDAFNSASSLNKAVMPLGQVYTGNDAQARGLYLRVVEKARKGGNRVYVLKREGVDIVNMPFHSNELVRKGVVVYADHSAIIRPKKAYDIEDFNLKFVGFPVVEGFYQSDLSMAPRAADLSEEMVEEIRDMLHNLVLCQTPAYLGKLIGWMTASHYRMLFHKGYGQFPLLHINGAAGAGKTSMVKLLANLHYYIAEPKVLTPSSTMFAVKEACSASSSIPLIIDEYKPHEMKVGRHDEFKLMFRDCYNNREVARGGGTRESSDYRSIQNVQLSAPVCFVAEAAESEPAVMERVILLTLVKAPAIRQSEFFARYTAASRSKHLLGVMGAMAARSIVNIYDVETLQQEFDPIYDETRKDLMLQPGEEHKLSFEEKRRKSSAKERTVFNYSVLKFGIAKFTRLAEKFLEKDKNEARKSEILATLQEMYATATSTVNELQMQTQPEWLRVLNTFSLMASLDRFNESSLQHGSGYGVYETAEGPILEIDPRQCYMKYRTFCQKQGDKPLFPSEMAFTHAVQHLPSIVSSPHNLQCPGGSIAFDLEDLRLNGFIDLPTK